MNPHSHFVKLSESLHDRALSEPFDDLEPKKPIEPSPEDTAAEDREAAEGASVGTDKPKKKRIRMTPAERREQLLSIAEQLIDRDGEAGMCLTEVAEIAGVSRALVFHYYPNRKALAKGLLEREALQIKEYIRPPLYLTEEERLEFLISRLIRTFFNGTQRLSMRFLDWKEVSDVAEEALDANLRMALRVYLKILGLEYEPLASVAVTGHILTGRSVIHTVYTSTKEIMSVDELTVYLRDDLFDALRNLPRHRVGPGSAERIERWIRYGDGVRGKLVPVNPPRVPVYEERWG